MPIAPRRRPRPAVVRAAAAFAEPLEDRRLLAAQIVGAIPDKTGITGTSQTVDLQPFFNDPQFGVVRLDTASGTIDIETFDQATPLNAANFLQYVTANRYNGSVFHRAIAGFVLQGGSFYADGSDVPEFPAVASEPNGAQPAGSTSNVRGTVAFARLPAFNDTNGNGVQDAGEAAIPGGGPNSATSGFFFNLADNASNLDAQNGGFTVFGKVLGDGMTVVDALTTVATSNPASALVKTATLIDDVTYTVASSNPTAVDASIVDGNVKLAYGGAEGTATITVTATSLDGTSTVQSAFQANGTFGVPLGGTSGNKTATFTDADGTVTTVSYKGAGTAALGFAGTGLSQSGTGKVNVTGTITGLSVFDVTGSDASSVVTVTSKGGDGVSVLGSLTADGPVKSITAKNARLTGALTVGGAVGSLTLGEALNGSITIGGAATDKGLALSVGQLTDTSVTSATPIKSVKVTSAANADATVDEAITAPSISAVTSAGNFGTDLTVPGEGNLTSLKVGGDLTGSVTAHAIGTISVKGAVNGSVITATHAASEGDNVPGVKSFTVTGGVSGTTINSAGDIASVSVGSITGGSHLVAGATALGAALPTSTADFTSQAVIKSLKVKTAFSGTTVVASTIKTVKVGTLTVANGGVPFGFAADKVGTITGRSDSDKKFAVRSPADQTAANNQLNDLGGSGDFVVLVL